MAIFTLIPQLQTTLRKKTTLSLSHVAACEGRADGWGERACAVALPSAKIFWLLFHLWKSNIK